MNNKNLHYLFAFLFGFLLLTGCGSSTAPPAESDTPTAVILAADINGVLLGSNAVDFGNNFILDGSNSSGANGSDIVTYRWTALTASVGGLTVGTPLETITPQLILDFTSSYPSAGDYAYQLEVIDTDGNVSQASQILISVIDNLAPTAILSVTDSTVSSILYSVVPSSPREEMPFVWFRMKTPMSNN